jgi:hypothetical protein
MIPRCARRLAAALLLILLLCANLWAGSDNRCQIRLDPSVPKYFIYPEYWATCPNTGTAIRCYRYHWDWVCEKGENLFWDRRLEAAAYAACDCPLPEHIAPASPAVSPKPRTDLFGPGE